MSGIISVLYGVRFSLTPCAQNLMKNLTTLNLLFLSWFHGVVYCRFVVVVKTCSKCRTAAHDAGSKLVIAAGYTRANPWNLNKNSESKQKGVFHLFSPTDNCDQYAEHIGHSYIMLQGCANLEQLNRVISGYLKLSRYIALFSLSHWPSLTRAWTQMMRNFGVLIDIRKFLLASNRACPYST